MKQEKPKQKVLARVSVAVKGLIPEFEIDWARARYFKDKNCMRKGIIFLFIFLPPKKITENLSFI